MSNLVRTLKEVSRREVFLVLAFVVLVLGETLFRGLEPRTPLLILALLAPLPLVWRIRFPLEVLGTSVAILIVGELVAHRDDYPVALGCVALVAAYSAAAHLRGRRAEAADFLVIAAIVGSAAVAASKNWNGSAATNLVAALISLTILFRGAWMAGRWMQGRRDRERTAIAEREQKAQAALREERARIARELHDVVAHAMSVIVLQARGARHSLLERPDEAREAVDAVERTASHALSEMRRLLSALRDEGESAALAPQPSLNQIDALVADVRAAGLPVELRVEGASRELPAGIDLCAYRIVQEALTNTLKHAGPATASVLIRYADDAFEVEVTDTGAGDRNGTAPGQGLAGMRERVAVLGGQLQAGPQREGGYLVAARLPL
jgi:signal transduction histidine kinase